MGFLPRRIVIDKFHELREEGVGLSVISLAELYTGIYYSTDLLKARESLDNFLSFVSVLGVNDGICRIFGEENARLRREGLTILLIRKPTFFSPRFREDWMND